MKTFTKKFEIEFGDISKDINEYAKKNDLEIVSASITERWGYLIALVVFKEQ